MDERYEKLEEVRKRLEEIVAEHKAKQAREEEKIKEICAAIDAHIIPEDIEVLNFLENKKILITNCFNLDALKQKIELVREINAEYLLGATLAQLATNYGVCIGTIQNIINDSKFIYNNKILTTNCFNVDILKTKMHLVERIVDEHILGDTLVTLASKYNVSINTIQKIIKEN